MDQLNQADANDLQKAINDITNPGASAVDQMVTQAQEATSGEAPATEPVMAGDGVMATEPALNNEQISVGTTGTNAPLGTEGAVEVGGDLAQIKNSALADLKPIINTVELPAEEKFSLYKEMIEVTQDKSCIEPAYNAAKGITDDKMRAEALLFIVETINKIGA